ncbi:beta strand repeat-containing protein [Acidicapsa ligni]|uniref:beta strand repeat-containing protein n=1 Tax=Acidicapsa ligni TaxID=542300 RepID=UPI0021E0AC0A|nr:calcium-binding protein [Acidicapsa ligni]
MTDTYDLLEQLENAAFLGSNGYSGYPVSTGPAANQTPFYVDSSGDLNFGYGILVYDAVHNVVNTDALAAMSASFGGNMSPADLNLVSQWLSGSITLSQLNNSITSQDWRGIASDVMIYYSTKTIIPSLSRTLAPGAYNSLNENARQALLLVGYNAGTGFLGSSITGDLDNQNYAAAAYQLAFNTATSSNTAYEDRSLVATAFMLGFNPTINGSNSISSLTPTADFNSHALVSFLEQMAANTSADASYLSTTPVQSFFAALNPYIEALGFYVVQPSDTWSTIASAVNTTNSLSITGTELSRLNGKLGGTLSTGGIVYVPTAISTTSTTNGPNQTVIFDSTVGTDGTYYTFGPNLSTGKGEVLTLTAGSPVTFDANTVLALANTSSSIENVTLSYNDPVTLGTLALNTSTGAATLTLTDGTPISLSSTDGDTVLTPASTDTPEEALIAYLGNLGDSTTASALDTANFDYLNPTGTAYTVNGTVSGSNDTFSVSGTPGAHVTGVSGKTNILDASGDISQDTISNIQQANLTNVTLTGTQFGAFGSIAGSGSLTITSSGSYSLAGVSGTVSNLIAQDWGGTTLTGNSTAGQTLTASLFGNDTLNAGNGAGDTLVAGDGVDTINGGTGGDTFGLSDGLAAGSTLTGHGTGNTLTIDADMDISGSTITGIQTTILTGGIGLTVSGGQLAGLGTITAGGEETTIIANGGGTYSMANATVSGYLTMYADATEDTNLVGSASSFTDTLDADDTSGDNSLTVADGQQANLTATSSSGNNTLLAGNGFGDDLDVSDSTGNNSLTVDDTTGIEGNGYNDLVAAGSLGNNTLTANNASYDALSAEDSFGDNTLTSGNGDDDTLSVQGSDGNNTLTAGSGADDTLDASDSTGNNTLTAGSGSGDILDATDSTGSDTLNAGSGGDTLYAGLGLDTLNGGSGNDTFVVAVMPAVGTSITGGSGTDTLDVSIADLSGMNIAGVETLQDDVSGSLELSASQFAALTTFDNESGGAETLVVIGNSTYSLSGKTVVGTVSVATTTNIVTGNNTNGQSLSAGSTGDYVVAAGNGTGDTLNAGNGNDTLIAGTGGDTLVAGPGLDTLTGGSGNDTFDVGYALPTGDVLNGGAGTNGIKITAANASIANATLGNVTLLEIENGASTTLTLAQLNAFSTFTADSGAGAVNLSGAGVYSLSGKTVTGNLTLDASGSSGNFTITGNNTANQTLTGSIGTDTITTGTGADDVVNSNGTNDTVNVYSAGAWTNANGEGTVVNLDASDDIVECNADNQWINANGNDASVTVNGANDVVQVNGTGGWVDLEGDDDVVTTTNLDDTVNINNDDAWVNITSSNDTATASANNDVVNVDADTVWANVNGTNDVVSLNDSTDTVDVSGTNGGDWINVSSTNGYVFGSGTGDTINVTTSGNTVDGSDDSIDIGAGLSDTINGGAGDQYQVGSTFGAIAVNNASYGDTAANGKINFGSSTTDEKLWFKESGTNLVVDLLGTTDTVTINGWFGSNAGAQVSEMDADGLKLTTAVSALVSAMATYQTAHTSFNAQTATSMPTDTTLQSAITAAWHT